MKLLDSSASGNISLGPFCFGGRGPLERLCEGLGKFFVCSCISLYFLLWLGCSVGVNSWGFWGMRSSPRLLCVVPWSLCRTWRKRPYFGVLPLCLLNHDHENCWRGSVLNNKCHMPMVIFGGFNYNCPFSENRTGVSVSGCQIATAKPLGTEAKWEKEWSRLQQCACCSSLLFQPMTLSLFLV